MKIKLTLFAALLLVAASTTKAQTYTGTITGAITLDNNASITLSNATITEGIICKGSATITLVGENVVTGAYQKAGIQIGGSGTTLTIDGNGSLTATGGYQSAGIGLSSVWQVTEDVVGGNIVINGGSITATGGVLGAGIGTGVIKNKRNDPSTIVQFGNISIKGGTVTAIGGDSGDGIGKGYSYPGPSVVFGTITIYDGIDKAEASRIMNSGSVVYMHDEDNVTANKNDYFTIIEDDDRRVITPKDDSDYIITIAGDTEHGTIACSATTAKYGDKVTIIATPDFGYRLSRLVVKDADNNDVASTGNSFLMPKSNVTVSAVFEQGPHPGTTEFRLKYVTGPSPKDLHYESIYDGLTTMNLQKEVFYYILNESNDALLLDNDMCSIPYSGGTGVFSLDATGFFLTSEATGYYDITLSDAGNGKWRVSILKTVGVMDNIPDQTYTGSEITPEPLVLAGSLDLTKGIDYEYSYSNNTKAGTAKVTVTFKGDYASLDSVGKEFTIAKATPTVTAPTANTLTCNGNEQELVTAGSTDFGTLLYSLDGETYSESIPKGTDADTYTVYYKVEGSENWNAVEPQTVKVDNIKIENFQAGTDLWLSWKNGILVCHDPITIEDGIDFNSPVNFVADKVIYSRLATKDTMTIILPFDVPAEKVNGTIYQLAIFDGKSLKYSKVTDVLKANTPYLIYKNRGTNRSDLLIDTLVNVTVQPSNELKEVVDSTKKATQFGTYNKEVIACDDTYDYYGYNGGKFKKARYDVEMSAFRTAVRLEKTKVGNGLKAATVGNDILNIIFDDEVSDVVVNPVAEFGGKVNVYDALGRAIRLNVDVEDALEGLKCGIYMVNGKKVIVNNK